MVSVTYQYISSSTNSTGTSDSAIADQAKAFSLAQHYITNQDSPPSSNDWLESAVSLNSYLYDRTVQWQIAFLGLVQASRFFK